MTHFFSLEFLVAALFIVNFFLMFMVFLVVKRVNQAGWVRQEAAMAMENDPAGDTGRMDGAAQASAAKVLEMLEPLVKDSKAAALEFEDIIREKKRISKDLNEALDAKIISINLLLSRAGTLQKQMEEQQHQIRQSMAAVQMPQPVSPREPDVLDQQNQILDLYQNQMDVDTIAEQLSIPKGEVQLVVDLKEKFMAMEQG